MTFALYLFTMRLTLEVVFHYPTNEALKHQPKDLVAPRGTVW